MNTRKPFWLALTLCMGVLAAGLSASSNYTILTSCPFYASNDTATVAFRVVLADAPTCDPSFTFLAVTSPSGVNTTYAPYACDPATGIHSFLISSGESGTYTVQPFNANPAYLPTNATACQITSYKRAQLRVPDNQPLLTLTVGILAAGMVAFRKRAKGGKTR